MARCGYGCFGLGHLGIAAFQPHDADFEARGESAERTTVRGFLDGLVERERHVVRVVLHQLRRVQLRERAFQAAFAGVFSFRFQVGGWGRCRGRRRCLY